MYRISNGAFAGCAAVILLPNRCQIWQISYGFQDEVLMRYAFSWHLMVYLRILESDLDGNKILWRGLEASIVHSLISLLLRRLMISVDEFLIDVCGLCSWYLTWRRKISDAFLCLVLLTKFSSLCQGITLSLLFKILINATMLILNSRCFAMIFLSINNCMHCPVDVKK